MKSFITAPILFFTLLATVQFTTAQKLPADLEARLAGNQQNSAATASIDNSIDEAEYYVGGGDVFRIAVLGLPSQDYSVAVNQEGDLFLPDFGVITLGRIPLKDAKLRIAEFIGARLKSKNQVYVTLSKTKEATITISGMVAMPGTYKLSGTKRLLDALREANNDYVPNVNLSDYRAVQCKNKDSISYFDLFEFLFANNVQQNPYVYPGDNISIREATAHVMLKNGMKNWGTDFVPIKAGEQLDHLLSLLPADKSLDTNHIILARTLPSPQMRTVTKAEAASIILANGDIITIPVIKDAAENGFVSISGEVSRPGSFGIIKNNTAVAEIIEQAGGYTSSANIKKACIIRTSKIAGASYADTTASFVRSQTGISSRTEINTAFDKFKQTKDYAIIPIGSNSKELMLIKGDQIIVPKTENLIYISGNVRQPGAYEYKAGANHSYYIGKAGGYTSKADQGNVVAMTQYTNTVLQFKDIQNLEDGDIILVPDASEGKTMVTYILPVISAIAAAVSIVANIVVLGR